MRNAVHIITSYNVSLWLFYLLCFLQTSFLLRPRSNPFLAKKVWFVKHYYICYTSSWLLWSIFYDEHDLRYGLIKWKYPETSAIFWVIFTNKWYFGWYFQHSITLLFLRPWSIKTDNTFLLNLKYLYFGSFTQNYLKGNTSFYPQGHVIPAWFSISPQFNSKIISPKKNCRPPSAMMTCYLWIRFPFTNGLTIILASKTFVLEWSWPKLPKELSMWHLFFNFPISIGLTVYCWAIHIYYFMVHQAVWCRMVVYLNMTQTELNPLLKCINNSLSAHRFSNGHQIHWHVSTLIAWFCLIELCQCCYYIWVLAMYAFDLSYQRLFNLP